MIAGVPVFSRLSGVSDEALTGASAETSVFAGRSEWRLTLPELFERMIFTEQRHMGFFVIDCARLSIAHHVDTESGEEGAMSDAMQAAAEAEADGFERFKVTGLGDGTLPSAKWELRQADGDLLNPSIVDSGFSLNDFESSLLDLFLPVVPSHTAAQVLTRIIDAAASGTTRHAIILASQRTRDLHVWTANLGTSTLPDFTLETTGDALLDSSWGFTARLELP